MVGRRPFPFDLVQFLAGPFQLKRQMASPRMLLMKAKPAAPFRQPYDSLRARALRGITAPCHRRCDNSPYFVVNLSDEHDVQSYMYRQTIFDMQDTYWDNCYEIYFIQSQYKHLLYSKPVKETAKELARPKAKCRHLCILVWIKHIL